MTASTVMTKLETITYKLWYGPVRRPFRALIRRTVGRRKTIALGPLSGRHFSEGDEASRLGIYELHVQSAIWNSLDTGDVLYDVGANNGYLTLLGATRAGAAGFVYAFEPLPQNINRISAVMRENIVENYALVARAVSNEIGTVNFYLGNDHGNATPSLIPRQNDQSLLVQTTTLDEFARENRWPDLIKLDIEGAEMLALQGASRLLAGPRAPAWVIELHDQENARAAQELLRSHGYELRTLAPPYPRKDCYPCHVAAWKPNER